MRRMPLAALIAGCAVVGAGLGAGLATAAGSPGAAAQPRLPVVAHALPSVLERPQRAADLDRVPATAGIARSSLRRLAALQWSTLLAGRSAGGDVCLVAVSMDQGIYRAACLPEHAFLEDGVGLAWSSPTGVQHRSASWDPDGTVRAGASIPQ